ncbi:hypothetical protein ACFTAO_14600 [Paenibacillus rhizoplanae]
MHGTCTRSSILVWMKKTSLAAISYGRDWTAEALVYTEEYRLEYYKEGFMLEREGHRSRSDAVVASI